MTFRKFSRIGSGLVLAVDLLISLAFSCAAVLMVRWLTQPILDFTLYLLIWLMVSFFGSLAGFLIAGTSRVVIKFSSVQSFSRLFYAVVIKELILALCLCVHLFHFYDNKTEILILGFDALFTLLALIMFRVVFIVLHNRLVENMETEIKRVPVLIYGLSDASVALMLRLDRNPLYKVEGFITRAKSSRGSIIYDCEVYAFGNEQDIAGIKRSKGICAIMFATSADAESEENGLVMMAIRSGMHIIPMSADEDINLGGVSADLLSKTAQSEFIPDGMTAVGRFFKRGTDLILSGLLIVVFAIPMFIFWVLIKLDDGGPAIFRQERIGLGGRPFEILKFRTMDIEAEKDGPALYSGDDDPRMTKIGRFLRNHHLDEMPQLFNVFKGDMAFVGYRPERPFYIKQIMEKDPRYSYLYQIRPGVTSYATLKNGYTDTMDKMLRRLKYDLYYLRHRSVAFDVEILWRTFTSIMFGKKI